MAYHWKYTRAEPPFNFLGNFALSQWQAMQAWIGKRQDDMESISMFHRIRAEQLRKTAGILEKYYSTVYPKEPVAYAQKLTPTFQKPAWKPGPYGHFNFSYGDDQIPMVMVGRIKTKMTDMLQRDEDAVYYMNQVRCLIEKHEDLAQYTHDFVKPPPGVDATNPQTLQVLLAKINSYFSKPEYQTVLVDDVNQGNMYKGQPYGRPNQAETPVQWELEQANHSSPDTPIGIMDSEPIS